MKNKIERMMYDIKTKASNNFEKQAYIRPSNYGFERTADSLNECLAIISAFDFVKKAEISGKDLIDVILK